MAVPAEPENPEINSIYKKVSLWRSRVIVGVVAYSEGRNGRKVTSTTVTGRNVFRLVTIF